MSDMSVVDHIFIPLQEDFNTDTYTYGIGPGPVPAKTKKYKLSYKYEFRIIRIITIWEEGTTCYTLH